jgi:hypothetical protein
VLFADAAGRGRRRAGAVAYAVGRHSRSVGCSGDRTTPNIRGRRRRWWKIR